MHMSIGCNEADAIIHGLGRKQHGVVHRRQLYAASISKRQIETRCDAGALIRMGHDVFALASAPATHLRQYKAAELAVPGAAVCGLAAAKLLDLGATRSAPAEIAVPPGANHRCSFAKVRRRSDVAVTEVKGIRTTSVAQTLVDLSLRLRLARVEEVWTSALIRDRSTLDELEDRVVAAEVQHLRHRGIARALIDSLVHGVDLAESELEALLYDLAARVPGVPPLVRQMQLPWWKGGKGRTDVGIPAWRTILEADGRSWHARLADFDADRMRDNLAAANGYIVLRFGAVQLRRAPEQTVEIIAATGRHRRTA
ncbi:MAG TPA: DUF559 domain-containing protein [Acidimicrobiales bacterium]|nr:DUF559 domain-containing protein [Acidimicrobiales bacterium]